MKSDKNLSKKFIVILFKAQYKKITFICSNLKFNLYNSMNHFYKNYLLY